MGIHDVPAPRRLAPVLPSGSYFAPISSVSVATSTSLGIGSLRVAPWLVERSLPLARLVGDIATAGEAGSKFRMGIWADTGSYYPGALAVDAGQIAGDSATVQELVISLTLEPGIYWLGGAVQAVTTTQPAVRTISAWTPRYPLILGAALPAAAAVPYAYATTGVTGALPATFPAGATPAALCPRLMVRTA